MSAPLIPLSEDEITFTAIRAQGAGGQNVNKVSSAVHARFDIRASSLPDEIKESLLTLRDHRISEDGVVIIKAQTHRSQGRNRAEALQRLRAMIEAVMHVPTERKATRPTAASKRRRLQTKAARGQIKRGRARPGEHD